VRAKNTLVAVAVAALFFVGAAVALEWGYSTDPETAGVAASHERLVQVRAAQSGGMHGPCNPGAKCVVSVPCLQTPTLGCVNPQAYCTNGEVTGQGTTKSCGNTDQLHICVPVQLQTCFVSTVQCEPTNVGCTCTDTGHVGKAIGQYSSC
jgi:hypothetical protein